MWRKISEKSIGIAFALMLITASIGIWLPVKGCDVITLSIKANQST